MAIRAVIWDLGGVLLRTENTAPRQHLAERFGKNGREIEYLFYSGDSGDRCQLGEITYNEHVQNVARMFDLTLPEMDDFVQQFWGGDSFDFALVDYIRDLRRAYKSGLLSNAFSNLREWLDEDGKVDGAFDDMIISAEVGLVKPDPAIYHLSLAGLDVAPSEAIFIDDMQSNVDGARAVGMHAIRFVDPDQVRADLSRFLGG